MFEKITKTLSGLAFIKYINSLIDYVNTSDIDATRIKGQLDISNIPPAGLDNVIKVDTVTDMLALTVDDVQNGDTVMIIGVTPPVQYQVVDDTKLGTMDAFQEYAAGAATKALADINGNNIHTTYGKLAGNNTWTGNNYWNGNAIFNANLSIRGSATNPDNGTYLWLGIRPEGSEKIPSIARNKMGDLVIYAADHRPCYLRSGIQTSFASVYNSDGTVEFSSLNNTPWGKYTNANGLELTVHKTPTVNNDVPNKKYVDDSVASATADLLSSNNTWAGSNTYNSNIVVKANGTAEVVEGSVYLGRSSKTNQARITGDATGNLYLTNSEDGYTHINNGSNSVAYFGNATIRFYKPTYITNGSSAGSSATLYLGVKPTNETVQARIGADNLGGLFYHASTNQPHVFRVGTNNNVFVIRDDNTKVAFSSNNKLFATVTHDGVAKWLGNANTATKLETSRTINGVSFDGTANITIADSTKLPIAGGTMTGDLTLKGNPTADLMAATKKYVDDSVASVGSGFNLTIYTSLEQIGITPGEETFASIHSALPINSVLECYVSEAQNFADIYPASYGNFIATRLTGDITIFHFTGTNQIMYVTHYHVTNNTNPSWTQIAKQSDLTNLSNSVVKSVNGIKPTNGNVAIDIPKSVIASEAEAKAGTDNTKFMTPLRVKQAISALVGDSSWTISKGTNGWARENSTGLTVQWGYVNRNNSGTFTFPRTFTTCYYSNVMCSSNLVPYITARSNTNITFNTNNGYNDDIKNWGDCYMFAIGVS
nr:MAG TPA: Dec protein, OB-Fold, Decoration, VIRAL PROTEIN [Caudoviricetes sp.]